MKMRKSKKEICRKEKNVGKKTVCFLHMPKMKMFTKNISILIKVK